MGIVPTRGLVSLCWAAVALAEPSHPPLSPTNIFAPLSTPAKSIFDLSLLLLEITGAIFVVVFALLVYAVIKFRKRGTAHGQEPTQVYGSTQLELAWTVIPVLIRRGFVPGGARVSPAFRMQIAAATLFKSPSSGISSGGSIDIPHWEVVTANELHIPVSDPANPTPLF
jgi:cytochrome c oxidase subunit II